MRLANRTLARLLILPILVAAAALHPEPAGAEQVDVCMPDEFFAVNATYFPFTPEVDLADQWFSLEAQRERVDTFPDDTQYVGSIDAYDLGFRYLFVGTHQDREILTVDSCFLQQLPEPVQEPICFAQGASRGEALSLGYAPLQNVTLENTGGAEAFTQFDALVAEIGSVSVPVRIVERISGRPLLLLEFWNFRFEVEPAELEIPAACDGVPPPSASGASSSQLRDRVSERSWELLQRMPATRRLLGVTNR